MSALSPHACLFSYTTLRSHSVSFRHCFSDDFCTSPVPDTLPPPPTHTPFTTLRRVHHSTQMLCPSLLVDGVGERSPTASPPSKNPPPLGPKRQRVAPAVRMFTTGTPCLRQDGAWSRAVSACCCQSYACFVRGAARGCRPCKSTKSGRWDAKQCTSTKKR